MGDLAELVRLREDAGRSKNWKRWGPYLSERQWGTVREDYSATGDAWAYFNHDHARSRAYRWGEDGLLGVCDRECRLCFAVALWNGRDPILKERLFGLSNPEGNHGEDVKECYYYLDSTPTHSYLKGLYKYPQAAFPYERLVEENRRRGKDDPEFELIDSGVFDEDRYFDVFAEYAKADCDDILIRLTVANRGPDAATLHVLPTLWARNTWSWAGGAKPRIEGGLRASHPTLGEFHLAVETHCERFLFTDNETKGLSRYAKDAFHEYLIKGDEGAVNPEAFGTKAAAHYRLEVPARGSITFRLRLAPSLPAEPFGQAFEDVFAARIREADEFYDAKIPGGCTQAQRQVVRQAYAGLLWSKQFYHYIVEDWLKGDPALPAPPPGHARSRNADWKHLFNNDVISMPDKWEYPWYAAWDLAFHMIPFSRIDPDFAKSQLVLFLREWYTNANGQIPAYEWNFSDVNPPVHAWACWRTYKITAPQGERDVLFLERIFPKLLINFTWWINRKDINGKQIFGGGFLGLDNIGIFDRSKPLPNGEALEQADGTAWMACYCGTMLSMALELAMTNPAYEDIASKFFEHFVQIVDAMNSLGDGGLWNEEDGFYYDQMLLDGRQTPLRVRSLVGVIPLLAVEVLEQDVIARLPGFSKRMKWFLDNRKDLAAHISYMETGGAHDHRLLAIPSRERLLRVLRYVLDEKEFLSPHGLRSLSAAYRDTPYCVQLSGEEYHICYEPAESRSGLFGGNSNWRGPVWFPINYLFVEAMERYHHFYGDTLRVECPAGSGKMMNLGEVALEISRRLGSIFLPDERGNRPCNGGDPRYANDPNWRDLLLFNEYFHGDTGRGLGAAHQNGWTTLVTRCLAMVGRVSE